MFKKRVHKPAGAGAKKEVADKNAASTPTSVVAFGMLVEGKIVPHNDKPFRLHVDGKVRGDIEADQVIINETGSVEGNIKAQTVVIKGAFLGDIDVDNVAIAPSAKVKGNIDYVAIDIEHANIEASLRPREIKKPAHSKSAEPVNIQDLKKSA